MGFFRAIRNGRGLAVAGGVGVFGVCLLMVAAFPPDPVDGFPPGALASVSLSGVLHRLFGAIGFVALAVAAFAYGSWTRTKRIEGQRVPALVLGCLVLAGFVGGAALAPSSVGVALLWIAVIAGWLWLALACARLYRWTPHPDTGARS